MDIQELKTAIEEKYGEDEFRELIMDLDKTCDKFDTKVGLHYQYLERDEDYVGDDTWEYKYRFQIADTVYEVEGSYCSWDGGGIEQVMDFYEVKPVQKTVTVYEKV